MFVSQKAYLVFSRMMSILGTTSAMASDAVQSAVFGWPSQPPINKIDTHHHIVPDFYAKAVAAAGGDPSGWPTPVWSPQASELMMNHLGIKTAMLSVTAPGACILNGTASHDLARRLNEFTAVIRDAQPSTFGFFANLPNILETAATLHELAFAMDTLNADGVILFTRYGEENAYLGHPSIEPIWAELNQRKAVVFIHPTHPVDTNKVNPRLPQPLIDYPHETTRAAMDMITSGIRRKYPNCTVILSHAGGSLPYLISRVIEPLKRTGDLAAQAILGTSYSQAVDDFRSFHYDLALSTAPQVLRMVLEMVPHDHILYGSDFPYAPAPAYPQFLQNLEEFNMSPEVRDMINFGNARGLFPRLADNGSEIRSF
ncbi:putative 2-amino-3-carboxymuconate-6-semialdehyde decarboxylase [Periconia macrospinosa]|uniref:6-methylsalicylate decarboxylase n=1 Tax=Periconia macrospinosa TaxID=97972 RepID=A0A2V1D106_9PLEO|nr:putative 2-amino-3-carboxymuconate-6-semialdehyde decarboxylase [Periconia macrospinosa]